MDKLVIFNVGGGMASYCEIGGKRVVIDIGSSEEFSPTLDFLIPYAKKCGRERQELKNDNGKKLFEGKKYIIDQLIISHPHRDHLSDIENFDKDFYPELVTTPNDNFGMGDESLNWDLVFGNEEKDEKVIYMKDRIINSRKPPLQSCSDRMELYYINPKVVENMITPKTDYVNNVSLVCVLNISGKRIMLPGDIMKSGLDWMLDNRIINIIPGTKTETVFKNAIKRINILVAPHHGLVSAYNNRILDEMKGGLELIIIPEDISHQEGRREIASGYYNTEYGSGLTIKGINANDSKKQSTIKTSTGHIVILGGEIYKVQNNENLIDLFAN